MQNIILSLRKNCKGIVFILFSAVLVASGQFFWKLSEGKSFLYLFLGFVLYGFGAILMMIAFKYGSFSVLHPMLCSSYVVSLIIGNLAFHEPLTLIKIIGVLIISLGVVFMGGSD